MNAEVIRRQYLDAMGISTWASRYQLPHALETPVCEWEDVKPESSTPSQRLHALLDDAQQAEAKRQVPQPSEPAMASPPAATSESSSPQALRSLLGDKTREAPAPKVSIPSSSDLAPSPPVPEENTITESATDPVKREALVFTLSCCCIDDRWLTLLPGQPDSVEKRLLDNMLYVITGRKSVLSDTFTFRWPPLANGPMPDNPLEEARDGIHAFLNGAARRNGWQLERVLWWGKAQESPFDDLLNIHNGHSQTLGMPVWQGDALPVLCQSADAKRALLPALLDLRAVLGA
ncbi:hypothetical protein ACLUEY_03350 [Vreelandella aquamarina]